MTHKAVFLDRDDTLISDPGYISHPNQIKLLPGTAQSLAMLKKMGYLLVVVTNQSGVARGMINEKTLSDIHHHLKKLLADEEVYLDAIYYCPYHPEGTVEKYTKESDLRKPQPGMLLKAAKELDIDLTQSWMIGDSYRDVGAGHRAGCRTILLDTPGKPQVREYNDPEPDKRAVNLREAVNILRMFEFQQKAQTARAAREEQETNAAAQSPDAENEIEPTVSEQTTPPPSASSISAAPSRLPPAPVEETPVQASPIPAPPPAHPVEMKTETKPQAAASSASDETSHQLLEEILHHVKSKNRYDQYAEFSVFMLLAWLVQALAAFSLVLSVWFWLDRDHGVEAVQTMIGYAVALQLLVIALLMMHEKNQ